MIIINFDVHILLFPSSILPQDLLDLEKLKVIELILCKFNEFQIILKLNDIKYNTKSFIPKI